MRYLKASFVIGILSALLTSAIYLAGLTRTLDLAVQSMLGLAGKGGLPIDSAQFFIVAVVALAMAWTSVDIVRPLLKGVVAALAALLLLTGSWVVSLYGSFVSPFPAVLAVVCSLVIGLIYGRSGSGSRKRILQRLFGSRISRRHFNHLINGPTPTTLVGSLCDATVLVCEIRNRDQLISALKPEDFVAMMNLYLQTASDFLVEAGGYLDECDGESIRVVFGAPVADEEHAQTACRAALELASRLDNLNKECDATWNKRIEFRMGINSGEMVGGAYGGWRMGSYSVAGRSVEFARKLCAAAANYGARIIVGPESYAEASELFEARPIDMIRLPGTGRRMEIYEILSEKKALSEERARSRDAYWRGYIYFRERQFDKAIDEFTRARIPGLPDPVLDFYAQRVERARRGEDTSSNDDSPLAQQTS